MRLLGARCLARRLARRLIAAVLCRYDVHDLPHGQRRVAAEEIRAGVPVWISCCPWCGRRFIVQAEARLDATARAIARQARATRAES